MQRFQVVDHGISHESLSRYTHEALGESIYQENTIDKWDIPWYNTRERWITILYPALENKVNATYPLRMMGRLDVIPSTIKRLSCILIGSIFYGMV